MKRRVSQPQHSRKRNFECGKKKGNPISWDLTTAQKGVVERAKNDILLGEAATALDSKPWCETKHFRLRKEPPTDDTRILIHGGAARERRNPVSQLRCHKPLAIGALFEAS